MITDGVIMHLTVQILVLKMNVYALGGCAHVYSMLMLIGNVEWDYLMQSDIERISHTDCDKSLSPFVERLHICLFLEESLNCRL